MIKEKEQRLVGSESGVICPSGLKGFRFLIFVLEWNLNEDKSNTH
jgi:hypothetical protein